MYRPRLDIVYITLKEIVCQTTFTRFWTISLQDLISDDMYPKNQIFHGISENKSEYVIFEIRYRRRITTRSVSYTHLTLPTIYSV